MLHRREPYIWLAYSDDLKTCIGVAELKGKYKIKNWVKTSE